MGKAHDHDRHICAHASGINFYCSIVLLNNRTIVPLFNKQWIYCPTIPIMMVLSSIVPLLYSIVLLIITSLIANGKLEHLFFSGSAISSIQNVKNRCYH